MESVLSEEQKKEFYERFTAPTAVFKYSSASSKEDEPTKQVSSGVTLSGEPEEFLEWFQQLLQAERARAVFAQEELEHLYKHLTLVSGCKECIALYHKIEDILPYSVTANPPELSGRKELTSDKLESTEA